MVAQAGNKKAEVKVPSEELKGAKKFAAQRAEVDSLTKRRFFYRQGSDIYGGAAGFFAYGPPGCAMKNNMFSLWRQHFVVEENMMEIEDTCIMQERVLKASGHVDKFSDFVVKDSVNQDKFWRADKLLEEVMEKRIEECKDEKLKQEYKKVLISADAYSAKELVEVFEKYNVRAPESGNPLTEPVAFNLMFPTPIGPVGGEQGYLRPETAQGIFLNYKFCKEQNGEKMPFGIAQIGKVFRNEIAPRAGLTRQREFQQAEIEWFIKPGQYAHPKWNDVKHVELTLWSAQRQEEGLDPIKMSLEKALNSGIIKDNNETMGYFIARTYQFLVKAGCNGDHLRFRQHKSKEMAHYACDCWDAESETSYGWLEIVGIANRACFDLNAHSVAAKQDLMIRETLKTPIDEEKTELTKDSAKQLMIALKADGKATKTYLEALPSKELKEIQERCDAGENVVLIVNDKQVTLPGDKLKTTTKMVKKTTDSYLPSVIEPSFGVDRIMFTIFEHSYVERPADPNSSDTQKRAFLSLPANVAPYKYTVLPVDGRITKHDDYAQVLKDLKRAMTDLNISGGVDDSGAAIGKRYARNDEIGIPFAITFDNDTFENKSATLRERNSCGQLRAPLKDIPDLVQKLFSGLSFADAQAKYKTVENKATALVGIANTN